MKHLIDARTDRNKPGMIRVYSKIAKRAEGRKLHAAFKTLRGQATPAARRPFARYVLAARRLGA